MELYIRLIQAARLGLIHMGLVLQLLHGLLNGFHLSLLQGFGPQFIHSQLEEAHINHLSQLHNLAGGILLQYDTVKHRINHPAVIFLTHKGALCPLDMYHAICL